MATIAALKIAQKQAELTDPEYRKILFRCYGVSSCTMLTPEQRSRVLAVIRNKIRKPAKEKSPAERKIWAIWYDLRRYLPEVEHSTSYLIGIAVKANGGQDECRITRLDQLSARQTQRLIEDLKKRIMEEKTIGGKMS